MTVTDPGGLSATGDMEVVVVLNEPPRLRKAMPPVRTRTGYPTVWLELSEYFVDPEGQHLTYGATSSDTTVASIALSADTLAVAAVSEGTATVAVTATDPGGLSVTGDMRIVVTPNRAPVAVEPLPNWSRFSTSSFGFSLRPYFSDPDGDKLIYSAVSSNPGVASVIINSGGIIWMSVRSVGATTISVTATDPGGLRVTSEFEVKIVSKALPFRDDFESDESLDNGWILWKAPTVGFGEGMVRVTPPNRKGTLFAGLERRFGARNWTVSARMGNVTEDSWVQQMVWLRSAGGRRPAVGFLLQVGADPEHHWTEDDTNWRLVAWYGGDYGHEVIASGESEAVGGLGELVDVSLSHVGPTLSVAIADSVVFTTNRFGDNTRYYVSFVATGVWPADYGSTVPRTGVFDWVEVRGDTIGIWEPDEANGDTANWVEVNGEKMETWRTGPKWNGVQPLAPRIDEAARAPGSAGGTARSRGHPRPSAASSPRGGTSSGRVPGTPSNLDNCLSFGRS